MKTFCVAKTAVIDEQGQVLLLRRSATDPRRPGEWDFPGGAVEAGESFVGAVARELAEEAGITLTPDKLLLVYTATAPWEPTDESISRFLFVAHVPAATKVTLSFEHDEYKWVDPDTALAEFQHHFYNPAFRYAREHGLLNLS